MPEKIFIFDTTLRDGEQSPGCSLNLDEKLQMARQLDRLGVDIMEVGFPITSEGDCEAVRAISAEIRARVPGMGGVMLSTHTHDDLGMAVANTLAGLRGGARQVECTVNGIGERAGNASLEEIVMLIQLRRDALPFATDIRTEELYASSQLLSRLTGVAVQRNKAVVGRNAFAHEAGIHQDGVLKNASTYEIMTPQSVGAPSNHIVLGKHSGRHALSKRYEELGSPLTKPELERAYELFCRLADRKKQVYDADLFAILDGGFEQLPETFKLRLVQSVASSDGR